jgi:hypothetical protein
MEMARPEREQARRDGGEAFGEGSDRRGQGGGDPANEGDGVGGGVIERLFTLQASFGVGARAQHGQHNQSECDTDRHANGQPEAQAASG